MEKKRHHYVPKAYLKAFCDPNGQVRVYRKDEPTTALPLAPDNAAFRRYYYAQPTPGGGQDNNTLEDHFSTIEAKWPAIVDKLRRREDINAQLGDVSEFISLQRARVPAARDAYEAMLAESVMTTTRLLDAAGKLPPKPKGLENILDHVEVAIDPHQSIHAMVTLIRGTGNVMGKIGIGCLHNRTGVPFLSSDNPVIWFDPSVDPAAMQPYNLREGGEIAFLFPVAPDLLIYGHSMMREGFARQGFSYGDLNEPEKATQFNREICRFAYEAVFASSAGQEDIIQEYAPLSPVLESHHIATATELVTIHRSVFGKRTKRPKWRGRERAS